MDLRESKGAGKAGTVIRAEVRGIRDRMRVKSLWRAWGEWGEKRLDREPVGHCKDFAFYSYLGRSYHRVSSKEVALSDLGFKKHSSECLVKKRL